MRARRVPGFLGALLALGCMTAACAPVSKPPQLLLEPVAFTDLPGWTEDQAGESVASLQRSCAVLTKLPEAQALGPNGMAGRVGDWRGPCAAAAAVDTKDHGAARRMFETTFRPYLASDGGKAEGLFTGYYEVELHGARAATGRYRTPLYGRPPDLVTVDLGQFSEELKGRRITGKVENGRLRPYDTRAQIDGGTLAGRNLEILWVDDPVDAFFLEIQGSGRVILEDGGIVQVNYAEANGRDYVPIGRVLKEQGALSPADVSMQTIRRWLAEHPHEARAMMERNPSYVFFRVLQGEGPLGAQGVALTPGRSLAVDRRFLALGLPIWLDTTFPRGHALEGQPLRRLMVAQDTGGAIRGAVRGDVFWGYGKEAADTAGTMKQSGRWYILLPRGIAAGGPGV